jgi:serine/threonine-protein kinase
VLEPLVVLAPAAAASAVAAERTDGRKRAVAYGLFGLLLTGVVVAIALFVKGLLGTDAGLVAAPALVGLTQNEAVAELKVAGLTVGDVESRFDPKPFGTVLEQSPAADILLRSGGAVSLVLSKGLEMTIVPVEVVGLSRSEAEVLLGERKLTVGEVVTRDGNIPEGTVLAISPQPGAQVPALSKVTLTVASGQIQVPDVRGKSLQEASDELQRAGFSVGIQPREDPGPPDRVLDQTPVNQLAPRGSTVVIEVSQVPAPPTPQPTAQPEPTQTAPEPSAAPQPEPSPS